MDSNISTKINILENYKDVNFDEVVERCLGFRTPQQIKHICTQSRTISEKLRFVKEMLMINGNMCIGGSFGLFLNGFPLDIKRIESSDLDFISFADVQINYPATFKYKNIDNSSSDEFSGKIRCSGNSFTKFDFEISQLDGEEEAKYFLFSRSKTTIITENYFVIIMTRNPKLTLISKFHYALKGAEKHITDLLNFGLNFDFKAAAKAELETIAW